MDACGMCKMPSGSDRLRTIRNKVDQIQTPLPKPSSSPAFPCPPLFSRSVFLFSKEASFSVWWAPGGLQFLAGGFVSQTRWKKKKEKERWREREKMNKEAENLRPPGGTSPHIVWICLTASQEGLHLALNTRSLITDQNKLPICSQQRCLPVKSPELHKI